MSLSSNVFRWDRLDEFKQALISLPQDLADEADAIVLDTADRAKDEAFNAYPKRTGNLRNGLRVEPVTVGRFGTGAIVVNKAPHAYIFEHGTVTRKTDLGANRGAMPPGNIFVPIMVRHRRQMYLDLMAMMRVHGIEVWANAA